MKSVLLMKITNTHTTQLYYIVIFIHDIFFSVNVIQEVFLLFFILGPLLLQNAVVNKYYLISYSVI